MTRTLRTILLAVLLGATVLLREAIGPIAAASVWAVCLVILIRSHPNRLLSLAPLYLLLLGMFHLGLIVPVKLNLVAIDPPDWIRSPQLGTALWLFTMATAAFTLGARLQVRGAAEERRTPISQPELFWTGLGVAFAGSALLWIGIYKLGIFETTYFGTYERAVTEDFRLYLFGRMVVPIGLLVAAAGATRRQMVVLGLLFAVVLGPLFFHGVRGPTILHASALLAVWAVKDHPTARRIGVVVAVLAIALVPVIRATRDVEGGSVSSGLDSVDPIEVLLEAGGSMYPLAITVEQVESGKERLWMGRSWAMAAGHVILNVSSRRAARNERDLFPNAWATLEADPSLFEQGGGIGYSAVAEPYLNFGPAGVVVFFLLLGLFIGACERWLTSNPFGAAIAAASFGFVLWTVRDDSSQVLRAVALACVAVLGAWILKRLRHDRHVAGGDAAPRLDLEHPGGVHGSGP
jgi:oligosaccharide repeat unit polymerase